MENELERIKNYATAYKTKKEAKEKNKKLFSSRKHIKRIIGEPGSYYVKYCSNNEYVGTYIQTWGYR